MGNSAICGPSESIGVCWHRPKKVSQVLSQGSGISCNDSPADDSHAHRHQTTCIEGEGLPLAGCGFQWSLYSSTSQPGDGLLLGLLGKRTAHKDLEPIIANRLSSCASRAVENGAACERFYFRRRRCIQGRNSDMLPALR